MSRELTAWRIVDLEQRIAEQKRRVAYEAGKALGSRDVLCLMEQTLQSWPERNRERAIPRRRGGLRLSVGISANPHGLHSGQYWAGARFNP